MDSYKTVTYIRDVSVRGTTNIRGSCGTLKEVCKSINNINTLVFFFTYSYGLLASTDAVRWSSDAKQSIRTVPV